jgi:hypothetical protein
MFRPVMGAGPRATSISRKAPPADSEIAGLGGISDTSAGRTNIRLADVDAASHLRSSAPSWSDYAVAPCTTNRRGVEPGCYYRHAGKYMLVPVAIQNPSGTEEQT